MCCIYLANKNLSDRPATSVRTVRRPKKTDEQRAGQEQVRPVFDTSYLLRNNTSGFLNFR